MTTKPRYVVGIDYSMTCPAGVCIDMSTPADFASTKFIYVMDSKKKSPLKNIEAVPYPETDSQEARFDFLAQTFVGWIEMETGGDVEVWLEDYAFNARGKVFHIGENTGLLKHHLWMKGMKFHVIAPTVAKKHGTGKGTADKPAMYESFSKSINMDLKSVYGSKMKGTGSPFSDLADAYFIAQYGATQVLCRKP